MSPTTKRKVRRTVKKVQEHTTKRKTIIHYLAGTVIGWHVRGYFPTEEYIIQAIGTTWAWAINTIMALGGGMVLVSLIMAGLAVAKFVRKDT
jgi:hypothetical protein